VGKRLEADYPETNRGRGFKLFPLWQTPFNNAGTLLPTLRISLVVACCSVHRLRQCGEFAAGAVVCAAA
jgi:hypothetical protein